MRKIHFASPALYFLFFANCVYAVKHGVNWLFWVTAALTAITLLLDVKEAFKHGNK